MTTAAWALLALSLALSAIAVCLGLLLVAHRRRTTQEVGRLTEVVDHHAEQIAALRDEVADLRGEHAAEPEAGYLITRIGEQPEHLSVPDQVVLSGTLGEPLLRTVALGHGVRRALAPESRNRIAFAMRQQLKDTRKARKADLKEALRQVRADRREESA